MAKTAFPSNLTAYFATNRNRTGDDYGQDFYLGDPKLFRVGTVDIDKKKGNWQAGKIKTFDEESQPAAANARASQEWTVLGSSKSFDQIRQAGAQEHGSDVLVFLHGAANDFRDAAETLALMAERYSTPKSPVCPFFFTYPANGSSDPFNYFADRDDASLSGHAIARSFGRLINYVAKRKLENRCRQRIHLVAHSLGNFALRKAVETIFTNPAYRRVRMFSSVILAAADDDEDTLDNPDKMRSLTRLTDQIVVYFDTTDKLLRLSDAVHRDRLGQKGPNPFPGHLVNGCRISVVDCENVNFDIDDDPQRHRHFLRSKAVVKDIRSVLRGEVPEGRTQIPGREGFFRL